MNSQQLKILLAGSLIAVVCYLSVLFFQKPVVRVEQGSAPVLPYQQYIDNQWKQLRWEGSELEEEQRLAELPEGSEYELKAHILGSDQTVTQKIRVVGSSARNNVVGNRSRNNVVGQPRKHIAARSRNRVTERAHTLPLSDVALIGDNRLVSNRELDIENLLAQDVTRYLYNYRETFGLSTEGYSEPQGWDSRTTKLKGHGSGHYMSALAFAYASSQDEAQKQQLMERIRRMVDEMRECQERTFVWSDSLGRFLEARDLAPEGEIEKLLGTWEAFDEYRKEPQKYGYGYINAIPAQHPVLVEMYRPYHNEKWVWAPYYTIHKQLAGLVDIAMNVDDEAVSAKALRIATDMGMWVWNRLKYRTYVDASEPTSEEPQRPGNRARMWDMYIAGEVGGMAEALTRISELVAHNHSAPTPSASTPSTHAAPNPSEPAAAAADTAKLLLEAASFFDAPKFFEPVSRGVDAIRNRHANQHIPMVTGALRMYRNGADQSYWRFAANFWELVQGRYVYSTGGVGNSEMFREPYTQMHSMLSNPDPTLNETCCAYNLAKLTRDLNCFNPDDARYMDYYERVLYNQIVGSVHPEHYGTTYHYAVGLNARKPFGNRTPQSSCCGGTGAENHVKYQEAAYFVGENTLWVALYLPTVARWEEKGVVLEQSCGWPSEHSVITIKEIAPADGHNASGSGTAKFEMKLRIPYWATSGAKVLLNGKELASSECALVDRLAGRDKLKPSSYFRIPARRWKEGDRVEIVLPYSVHVNYGADKVALSELGLADSLAGAESKASPDSKADSCWLGTLMLGPMAMSAEGIDSWEKACLQLGEKYENVERKGFSLKAGDYSFNPDYAETGHASHYLVLE